MSALRRPVGRHPTSGMSVRRVAFPYTHGAFFGADPEIQGTLLVRHVKLLKHNRRMPRSRRYRRSPSANPGNSWIWEVSSFELGPDGVARSCHGRIARRGCRRQAVQVSSFSSRSVTFSERSLSGCVPRGLRRNGGRDTVIRGQLLPGMYNRLVLIGLSTTPLLPLRRL